MGRLLFLAHGSTVSIYSVTEQKKKKWFAHYDVGEEIEMIFRQKDANG